MRELCTKMYIKVICFTNIKNKSLITNSKKRGPETVFVPAGEPTYVGSEKMGKWVIFTCDFIAFSNINIGDEYLALNGVSFAYINYKFIFHSSTAFEHQGDINMHMTSIFFFFSN